MFGRECGACGYKLKYCTCAGKRASGRTHGARSSSEVNPRTGQTDIAPPARKRGASSKAEHAARCRKQGWRPL